MKISQLYRKFLTVNWQYKSLRAGFLDTMILLCTLVFYLLTVSLAEAKDYTIAWSPSPEPVEGYKFYYKRGGNAGPPFDGTESLKGPSPIPAGKKTIFTITGLADNTPYHFALKAYSGSEESEFSPVVSVFTNLLELAAIIKPLNQLGQAPFTVVFDAGQSTGPITTYSWNFGDGSTANISSLSHTYTTPGTYTVTLSVADASGSSKQATIVITASAVQPPPDPTLPPDAVISTSPAVGNAPFTVQFDGSGSTATEPPIDSYSWDFGDGGTAEGVTASHTYSIPGDYYASLTVVDNIGQIGITSTPVKVNIGPGSDNQPPTASFTATPVSGAPPILVTFIASTSSDPDGTISQYQWNFGDGSLATGITAQHTFIGIAEYTVSLTVTDNLGKTAVTTKTVSVGAPGEKERNAAKAILPIIYQLLME